MQPGLGHLTLLYLCLDLCYDGLVIWLDVPAKLPCTDDMAAQAQCIMSAQVSACSAMEMLLRSLMMLLQHCHGKAGPSKESKGAHLASCCSMKLGRTQVTGTRMMMSQKDGNGASTARKIW